MRVQCSTERLVFVCFSGFCFNSQCHFRMQCQIFRCGRARLSTRRKTIECPISSFLLETQSTFSSLPGYWLSVGPAREIAGSGEGVDDSSENGILPIRGTLPRFYLLTHYILPSSSRHSNSSSVPSTRGSYGLSHSVLSSSSMRKKTTNSARRLYMPFHT